jgi:hypothetical protein
VDDVESLEPNAFFQDPGEAAMLRRAQPKTNFAAGWDVWKGSSMIYAAARM